MGEHLRAAFAQRRADPGEPGAAAYLSPKVSRVVYELRDRGVRTQPEAIAEIARQEGAGLNPGQIAAVLQQFAAPAEQDDD